MKLIKAILYAALTFLMPYEMRHIWESEDDS